MPASRFKFQIRAKLPARLARVPIEGRAPPQSGPAEIAASARPGVMQMPGQRRGKEPSKPQSSGAIMASGRALEMQSINSTLRGPAGFDGAYAPAGS